MGLGVGIFLIAIGAVMAFAINVNTNTGGVDLHTIGYILLAVGALGVLLSLVFWSSWMGPGHWSSRRSESVERPPTGGTTTTTTHQT